MGGGGTRVEGLEWNNDGWMGLNILRTIPRDYITCISREDSNLNILNRTMIQRES